MHVISYQATHNLDYDPETKKWSVECTLADDTESKVEITDEAAIKLIQGNRYVYQQGYSQFIGSGQRFDVHYT